MSEREISLTAVLSHDRNEGQLQTKKVILEYFAVVKIIKSDIFTWKDKKC